MRRRIRPLVQRVGRVQTDRQPAGRVGVRRHAARPATVGDLAAIEGRHLGLRGLLTAEKPHPGSPGSAPPPPAGNPHPGLTPSTLHRAPVGQGPPGPDWLAISFGFWSGRALATGTAWAGLCLIHHHHYKAPENKRHWKDARPRGLEGRDWEDARRRACRRRRRRPPRRRARTATRAASGRPRRGARGPRTRARAARRRASRPSRPRRRRQPRRAPQVRRQRCTATALCGNRPGRRGGGGGGGGSGHARAGRLCAYGMHICVRRDNGWRTITCVSPRRSGGRRRAPPPMVTTETREMEATTTVTVVAGDSGGGGGGGARAAVTRRRALSSPYKDGGWR